MEVNEIKNTVDTGSIQVQDMVKTIIGTNSQEIDSNIDNVRNSFLNADKISDDLLKTAPLFGTRPWEKELQEKEEEHKENIKNE